MRSERLQKLDEQADDASQGGSISLERAMSKLPKRLWHDESGQDLTEYALLVALIGLSAIVGMNSLAQAVSNVFTNAAANLSSAT
jgi:Flp pilus assembly pilin Flp